MQAWADQLRSYRPEDQSSPCFVNECATPKTSAGSASSPVRKQLGIDGNSGPCLMKSLQSSRRPCVFSVQQLSSNSGGMLHHSVAYMQQSEDFLTACAFQGARAGVSTRKEFSFPVSSTGRCRNCIRCTRCSRPLQQNTHTCALDTPSTSTYS